MQRCCGYFVIHKELIAVCNKYDFLLGANRWKIGRQCLAVKKERALLVATIKPLGSGACAGLARLYSATRVKGAHLVAVYSQIRPLYFLRL